METFDARAPGRTAARRRRRDKDIEKTVFRDPFGDPNGQDSGVFWSTCATKRCWGGWRVSLLMERRINRVNAQCATTYLAWEARQARTVWRIASSSFGSFRVDSFMLRDRRVKSSRPRTVSEPRAADLLNDGIDAVSVPPVLHYLSDFRGAWGNNREIDSEAEVESSQWVDQ